MDDLFAGEKTGGSSRCQIWNTLILLPLSDGTVDPFDAQQTIRRHSGEAAGSDEDADERCDCARCRRFCFAHNSKVDIYIVTPPPPVLFFV